MVIQSQEITTYKLTADDKIVINTCLGVPQGGGDESGENSFVVAGNTHFHDVCRRLMMLGLMDIHEDSGRLKGNYIAYVATRAARDLAAKGCCKVYIEA